ncbi:MAG: hypothetical protein B6I34_09200 [Anaerolineaceae bacterium 4572_32.1]|nr:MAG: hypothetical protein B6I34_09200 [Anaerolineaceae bacterium 4572_32.1]
MRRIRQLFHTTEGLLFTVTAWEALIVAFMGTFSATGPLAWLNLPARLGIALDEAGKIGRVIMLYHALALPFVAALVYFMLDALPFEEKYPRLVRPAITAGYMLTSVGGLSFAYFGGSWIAHGLFVVGLSLAFYAGVVLCIGLWPWRRETGGFSMERLAFWLMALYTLISAAIGGAAGAYFGNGFTAFLAEDALGMEHNLGQRAIIAHLHIMLTLIDVALLLIVARRFELRGRAYRAAMPLIIIGTTITSFATWSVMPFEEIAHKIINVGAAFLLPGAIIVALYGLARLARERALLKDPVRLGIFFELIFVNLVVTAPGVYVAFNLESYRQPAFQEVERTIAVGHWHVLATLSAVIALLLVMDRLGARGLLRQLVGWGVLIGSTLAFVFVQFYMFHRPGGDAAWTVPFLDVGIGVFLIALFVFLLQTGRSNIHRRAR